MVTQAYAFESAPVGKRRHWERLAASGFRAAGAMALLFLLVIATPLAWYVGAPLRVTALPRKSDVIALFSSGQIDAGWMTPDAAQRLLGAVDLFQRGYGRLIVTSGSQAEQGLDQADLSARWLIRAGVPPQDVLVENRSTRTYLSVLALRELMREHGWHSAVIVTSEMDVPRIALVCRHLGLSDISFRGVPVERQPKPAQWLYLSTGYPVLYHALYEYAGLALYWAKGWI